MNTIILGMEIQVLKNFLDKSLQVIDAEISIIHKEKSNGKFFYPDDFANALYPFIRQEEIVLRAVYNEINALVEWELKNIAQRPYHHSPKYVNTPKSLLDVLDKTAKLSDVVFVSELSIGKICKLIENHYCIKLSNISGYRELHVLRRTVNSFKHCKGFQDIRKDTDINSSQRFQLTRENTYQTIDTTKKFLTTLWETIQNNS